VAQYIDGFEDPPYLGSATGIELNGQNGFFNPDPPNSVSAHVYTYAGNALGLPVNPGGGDQFVGATGPGGSLYVRSEKNVTYGAGTGVWTVSYDIAATFTGTLPAAQNLGSFSTTPFDLTAPPAATFIALGQWTDPNTAANWDANYVYFDAAGSYVYPGVVPDPAFQSLNVNHWYRWSTTFDLDTNMITEVGLVDLTTGDTHTYNPTDWYLGGGSGGGLPAPSGFRFFAGSANPAGNTLAWDNLSIVPEPATLSALLLAGLALLRRR
jgi:hypothetical protein